MSSRDDIRTMVCPYCGHEAKSSGIGAVYCGPHRDSKGNMTPAVRMREKDNE
jgi:hypothetical protein